MKTIRPLTVAVVSALALLAGGVISANAMDARDDPPKPPLPADSGVVAPLSAHPQYQGEQVSIPAGGFGFAHVACPAGTVPTGGGGQTTSTLTFITDSLPNSGGWSVGVKNTADVSNRASAWVICTVA
ncbi:hypothetical protein ACFWWM_23435 [Streptomyces sp. NPDC058682]|uniref:hypothetical protein n=1 Tax=unclassified Streptomyces TaxID=2593676 RepID=UPI002257681D|nr:hypothetical protein [Streptomyces sp. NBC_01214]MCX4808458.1 hypothetical protein [Streptomyces sp. NBC_01214]